MALLTQSGRVSDALPDKPDGPSLLRDVLRQADSAQQAGMIAEAEALIERAYELLDAILAIRQ